MCDLSTLQVVVEADVGTDSDVSAHGHAHAADDAPAGEMGKRRKRRKRGEQPHSRGTPYKALGKPVLVPKWAQGAGPTKLVTKDAFTIALRGVLRGGTFDACTGDHAEHALVFRHQPAHDGLEGYRISCLNKCGLTLKAMMNIGGKEDWQVFGFVAASICSRMQLDLICASRCLSTVYSQ